MAFFSISFGAYQCFENLGFTENAQGQKSLTRNVVAGALAGCVGASVGSPFYMIKTHLQSRSNADIAVGHQHPYDNMRSAARHIYSKHGVVGLWRGASAAMSRVTIGSAVQLSTFSQTKQLLHDNQVRTLMFILNVFICIRLALLLSFIHSSSCIISDCIFEYVVEQSDGRFHQWSIHSSVYDSIGRGQHSHVQSTGECSRQRHHVLRHRRLFSQDDGGRGSARSLQRMGSQLFATHSTQHFVATILAAFTAILLHFFRIAG